MKWESVNCTVGRRPYCWCNYSYCQKRETKVLHISFNRNAPPWLWWGTQLFCMLARFTHSTGLFDSTRSIPVFGLPVLQCTISLNQSSGNQTVLFCGSYNKCSFVPAPYNQNSIHLCFCRRKKLLGMTAGVCTIIFSRNHSFWFITWLRWELIF